MPIWTEEIKHSVKTFAFAVVIFALAIGLTYVEDFCVAQKRPPWLIIGVQALSIWMFIVDAVVLFNLGLRVILRSIRSTKRNIE